MKFTKMEGCGNDYIYVDARSLDVDWPAYARSMSDRHFGIGSCLLYTSPSPRDLSTSRMPSSA